ncbi:MAG: hypothetical protein IJ009_01065 [Clostridia bacterium]|nr:hypothetical protein [Clostridia bacterium]
MTRKILFFLLLAVTLFATLALPLGAAAEPSEPQTNFIRDNLTSASDVNLHTFEMTEAGHLVLRFEIPDGGTTMYRWRATVLSADGQAVSEAVKIKDVLTPTFITLTDLSAGSYTVRMEATSNYTNKAYDLAILPAYASVLPEGGKNEVRVMDGAGLICQIDGHSFVKLYDGVALAALYRVDDGGIVLPMLVSLDNKAVEYIHVETGEHVKASSMEVNGKTYYYSYADWVDRYHGTGYQTYREGELYLANDGSSAWEDAKAIIVQYEKNEKGAFMYYLSHYWGWGVAVILIAAAIWVKIKFFPSSGGDDDNYYGGGSGGAYTGPGKASDSDAYGRPYGPGGPVDVSGI